MRSHLKKSITSILLFGLFFFATGCDSNNEPDPGQSFDQMGEMIAKSFDIFGNVAVEILLNPATKTKPIYNCDPNGTVDYNSSSTPNVYSLVFDNCNGIDGSINLGLTSQFTETSFDFGLSLDGSLTEACTMNMNNFSMNVVSQTQSGEDQILLNGSISSTCNGESFTCAFNNNQLTDASQDDLIQQSCSGSVG